MRSFVGILVYSEAINWAKSNMSLRTASLTANFCLGSLSANLEACPSDPGSGAHTIELLDADLRCWIVCDSWHWIKDVHRSSGQTPSW